MSTFENAYTTPNSNTYANLENEYTCVIHRNVLKLRKPKKSKSETLKKEKLDNVKKNLESLFTETTPTTTLPEECSFVDLPYEVFENVGIEIMKE